MNAGMNHPVSDRRAQWQPKPRPEWLARFNQLGGQLNIKSIVPLDEASLLDEARRNTGLDDFGNDGWLDHFRVLLRAIDDEAQLNFFGRILTRSDLLVYLEGRLNIIEAYRRHPEIDDEVIVEPVFILGFGRSGTTILHEVMSQDPQFRSVRRWEAMFPWPAPEAASYETDARIGKAQDLVDVVHALAPEWKSMHAWGGALPVEDLEFTYGAFFSEVWATVFQVPTYEKYFADQDPAYHFAWHKKVLKLLQWKYKKPHWLLKNPTHMPRIPKLLAAYPDAKIILPHRDPVTTTDSVVNVLAAIYSWRSDQPVGLNVGDDWMLADSRVRIWDEVIGLIEDGTLQRGAHGNILYADFMRDPLTALQQLYRDLNLPLDPAVSEKMRLYMEARSKGTHGNSSSYAKTAADDPLAIEERQKYQRYQKYFGVPNEA